MRPVAIAAILVAAACARASEPSTLRVGSVDYVNLDEAASRIGLRAVRSVPETAVMLKSGPQPVARLSEHSREMDLGGLRVFLGDPVIMRSGAFYMSREDFEFRILPRVRPDLCAPVPRVPRIVALDPGHGGEDHGSENPALRTMEKTYTLEVALETRRLLEQAGYKVVLTRDTDVNVAKQVRSEIANLAHADVFVSIHFNSLWPNRKTTGVEVLSFPPRTQRSTDSWSPNHKDDSEAADAPINEFNAWNSILSGIMHRRLLASLHDGDRGEKFEHLGVLRQLRCPGVLVEPAFISSDTEGAALAGGDIKQRIAAAIVEAINDYAAAVRAQHPATVSAPAAQPSAAGSGASPQAAQAPAARAQPTRPQGP